MHVLHTIDDTRKVVALARSESKSVGLVPTMGYFHEGHLSLMRRAKGDNDLVIVSVFVNPAQFGPSEDYRSYPRDMERDARMAEEAGVDLIFAPSADKMYPDGYQTSVEVEKLSQGLCGASRPGHFRGVATVVLKLLNIVMPDRAYFGRKDYQQLKVIERMVEDLNVPVEVIGMPIVREADGLAMSSRNTYLNSDERQAALVLGKSLAYAEELLDKGVASGADLQHRVEEFIRAEPLARIDYVALVHPDTLEPVSQVADAVVLAVALRIGSTRLIDNVLLERPKS